MLPLNPRLVLFHLLFHIYIAIDSLDLSSELVELIRSHFLLQTKTFFHLIQPSFLFLFGEHFEPHLFILLSLDLGLILFIEYFAQISELLVRFVLSVVVVHIILSDLLGHAHFFFNFFPLSLLLLLALILICVSE